MRTYLVQPLCPRYFQLNVWSLQTVCGVAGGEREAYRPLKSKRNYADAQDC